MELRRRWKTLLSKVDYLKLELDDVKETFVKYEHDFTSRVYKIENPVPQATNLNDSVDDTLSTTSAQVIFENSAEPGSDKTDDVDQDINVDPIDENRPEQFKKLWKSIAAKTHPDVTENDQDLANLYKAAAEAWKKSQFENLIDIAAALKLDIPDPDENLVKTLRKRCDTLEAEINRYTQSSIWQWGCANEKEQDAMVNGVVATRAARKNKTT